MSGRRFTFDEESRALFGAGAGTRDRGEFAAVRRQIDALIPGAATLTERYTALERRFLVPAARFQAVFARAVAGCREATIGRLTLPRGEAVELTYVRDRPWNAFTRYKGGRRSATEVNLDFALSVDRLLELACHETYPGHHAINVLTEPRAQAMYSPRSLRTEGAATFAVELAFPPDRRLAFERDELLPLAGVPGDDIERYLAAQRLVDRLRWLQVDVARRYLDNDLEFVRAADTLEAEALAARPAAEAMLKFFNRFRSYVVAYTIGRDLAADAAGPPGADDAARWRAYEAWIRP